MKNTLYILLLLMISMGGCASAEPQGIAINADAPVGVDLQAGESVMVRCAGTEQRYDASTVISGTVFCLAADTPTSIATPTETAIDTPTAAFTPIPSDTPTETNTPSFTETPTVPLTPTPQLTPVALAPLCPTHDDRFWHGLWDAVRGCHYDHVHGVDPNHSVISSYAITGVGSMGDMRTLQGGVDFGYAWQTTLENFNKHRGYTSQSAIDLPCEQQNYQYMAAANRKCIRAFTINFHIDHGTREGISRFHSMSAHVMGCERDGLNCGDIFTGGLSDTGDLHAPYKTTCADALNSNRPPCPTSQSVWLNQLNNPPYWAYVLKADALRVLNNGDLARNDPSKRNLPSNRMVWENYSSDRTPGTGNRLGQANLMLHINARTYNSSTFYDPVSRTFGYVCPMADCIATNDAIYIYAIVLEVPASLPKDALGYVNYVGFTDRTGRVSTRCTAAGVECVPLRIRHLKPGLYIYDMAAPFIPGARTWGDGAVTNGARYFDVTPSNVPCDGNPAKSCSWITLPSVLGQ